RSLSSPFAVALLLGACGSGSSATSSSGSGTTRTAAAHHARAAATAATATAATAIALASQPAGELPAAVQWPATTALGNRVLLMGGLDQATASMADVVSAGRSSSARIG